MPAPTPAFNPREWICSRCCVRAKLERVSRHRWRFLCCARVRSFRELGFLCSCVECTQLELLPRGG